MYKIAVVGDYNSVCGFAALGFEIFAVDDVVQAHSVVKRLANEGYGIIYLTESLAGGLESLLASYNESTTPCIVPLPGSEGNTGYGKLRLKHYVEQAVGSDIIFNEEKERGSLADE